MSEFFNPSRDQKAVAAYFLGYRSRTLWIWHELFWTGYFIDVKTIDCDSGLEDGPWLAAEEIDRARIVCGNAIAPHNYVDILDILHSFQLLPESTIESWWKMDPSQQRLLSQSDPPYKEKWERLQNLVETAFESENILTRYCRVGLAIGDYELAMERIPDLPKSIDQNTNMPCLAEAAKGLPADVLRDMPLLSRIVELEPVWIAEGPQTFFVALFNELDNIRGEVPRGLERFPLQFTLLQALQAEICSVLAGTHVEENGGMPPKQRPPTGPTGKREASTNPEDYEFAFCLHQDQWLVVYSSSAGKEKGHFPIRKSFNGFAIINFLIKNQGQEQGFSPGEIVEALDPGPDSSTRRRNEMIASEIGGKRRDWSKLKVFDRTGIRNIINALRQLQEGYREYLQNPSENTAIDHEKDCIELLQCIRGSLTYGTHTKVAIIDELLQSPLLEADFSRLNEIGPDDLKDLNEGKNPVGSVRSRVGKAITDAIDRIAKKSMRETAKYLESTIVNPNGSSGVSYVPVGNAPPKWVLDLKVSGGSEDVQQV